MPVVKSLSLPSSKERILGKIIVLPGSCLSYQIIGLGSSTVEACINVQVTTTAQGNPSHLELCRS